MGGAHAGCGGAQAHRPPWWPPLAFCIREMNRATASHLLVPKRFMQKKGCAGRLIALCCFAPCRSTQLLSWQIRQLLWCVNLRSREQKTQGIRPSQGSMRPQNSRQGKEKSMSQKHFFLLFGRPLCVQKRPCERRIPCIFCSLDRRLTHHESGRIYRKSNCVLRQGSKTMQGDEPPCKNRPEACPIAGKVVFLIRFLRAETRGRCQTKKGTAIPCACQQKATCAPASSFSVFSR